MCHLIGSAAFTYVSQRSVCRDGTMGLPAMGLTRSSVQAAERCISGKSPGVPHYITPSSDTCTMRVTRECGPTSEIGTGESDAGNASVRCGPPVVRESPTRGRAGEALHGRRLGADSVNRQRRHAARLGSGGDRAEPDCSRGPRPSHGREQHRRRSAGP